jgi:hypothetical protein
MIESVCVGVDTKGIFQKVPADRRHHLKPLKAALATPNAYVKLEEFTDSVGVVANVFKRYLVSLPEPIMTFKLYDSFVLAACKRTVGGVEVR